MFSLGISLASSDAFSAGARTILDKPGSDNAARPASQAIHPDRMLFFA